MNCTDILSNEKQDFVVFSNSMKIKMPGQQNHIKRYIPLKDSGINFFFDKTGLVVIDLLIID